MFIVNSFIAISDDDIIFHMLAVQEITTHKYSCRYKRHMREERKESDYKCVLSTRTISTVLRISHIIRASLSTGIFEATSAFESKNHVLA
jgi:hypothetical protein